MSRTANIFEFKSTCSYWLVVPECVYLLNYCPSIRSTGIENHSSFWDFVRKYNRLVFNERKSSIIDDEWLIDRSVIDAIKRGDRLPNPPVDDMIKRKSSPRNKNQKRLRKEDGPSRLTINLSTVRAEVINNSWSVTIVIDNEELYTITQQYIGDLLFGFNDSEYSVSQESSEGGQKMITWIVDNGIMKRVSLGAGVESEI